MSRRSHPPSNRRQGLSGHTNAITSQLAICCIFLFIFLSIYSVQCQFIEIQTELGRIRGVRIQSQLNNPAIAFLGIPYALPPLGERRFKKPISYPKWSPKTLMATNYKSCCPQLDMNNVPHGAEDCLYLNVFVPLHNLDQNQFSLGGKRFPVMVYFQGESFENGDAALYGAEKLLDWDVVLVTFNYRLGVLGFFSTGDEHAPGNWGLYDQLAVMRWVHDHIESFSGNPSSVTIFGQGAGASSAFLHLVSPLSTGLFHRVIAQSGSPLCSWSMENEPENAAHEVAQRIGCATNLGNLELVRCLRRAPLGRLLSSQQQGKILGEFPHRMVPVVEMSGPVNGRIVPADPKVLINQGNYRRVPLMMGYNKDDAAFLYPLILSKQFIGDSATLRSYLEEKLLPRFIRANILDRNSFTDAMSTNSIKLKANRNDIERDIANNILFKYFNFMNGRNYTDLAARFVNMSTDALYGACIDETLRLYTAATSTTSASALTVPASKVNLLLPFANITYKYVFAHRGRNSMLSLILSGNHHNRQSFNRQFALPLALNGDFGHAVNTAVCHGDELFHLFALKFPSRKPEDNRDLLVQRKMLSLWTDFAKHGFAPLSAGIDIPYWPSYTNAKPIAYVIDSRIQVIQRYGDSATHFWTRYLPSIASNSASAPIIHKPHSDKLDNGWSSSSGRNNGQYYDRTSVARLRTFAWSMLAVSTILLILIFVLLGLLYYQRRKQTFSAESRQRARQTSARALARALATSARQTSSTAASTSALY